MIRLALSKVKNVSPCFGCKERNATCHCTGEDGTPNCPGNKYQLWRAEVDEANKDKQVAFVQSYYGCYR